MSFYEEIKPPPPKEFDQIDKEHRVLNIGRYNPYVSSCGLCPSNARIETFGKDCLGFGVPDLDSQSLDRTLAVVYECPECFERLWSHASLEGGYYRYLRYLLRYK